MCIMLAFTKLVSTQLIQSKISKELTNVDKIVRD